MRDRTQSQIVGQRIAAARKVAGLSAQALAARLGWARETLVNFELGRRSITIERLRAIADALECHPAELFFDRPDAARLAVQIATDERLAAHVQFFVSALDHDNDAGS